MALEVYSQVLLLTHVLQTFFSTDIIKYQSSDGGEPGNGKYSDVAMMRWLQVTLPLTVVTMCTAWMAYTMSAKKKSVQDHAEKRPKVDDIELAQMGKEVR